VTHLHCTSNVLLWDKTLPVGGVVSRLHGWYGNGTHFSRQPRVRFSSFLLHLKCISNAHTTRVDVTIASRFRYPSFVFRFEYFGSFSSSFLSFYLFVHLVCRSFTLIYHQRLMIHHKSTEIQQVVCTVTDCRDATVTRNAGPIA
jgi:hypothetical protein